jgi:hypothetical protein
MLATNRKFMSSRHRLLASPSKSTHSPVLSTWGTTLKVIRPGVFVAMAALLALIGPGLSQPAPISWPDAVAQMAGERAKAETCVALVKKYGDAAQIARGQLTYTKAKADIDAVIAGLIITLSARQEPVSLPGLQGKLSSGISDLAEFCKTVSNLLPDTAGQKNVAVEIAKVAIEPLLKVLSDGVSALYNNYRDDDALTRRTIQTQLEAARWPAFAEVKAAQ